MKKETRGMKKYPKGMALSEQLLLRTTPKLRKLINKRSNLLSKTPQEYIRGLIVNDIVFSGVMK